MAEIEFRLPSKVPYAYVNVRYEVAERPSAVALAEEYAHYLTAYRQAEEKALKAALEAPAPKLAESPKGDEGTHEEAVQAISEGLGATVVSEDAPPWERKVDAQPKPWQTSSEATPPNLDDLF